MTRPVSCDHNITTNTAIYLKRCGSFYHGGRQQRPKKTKKKKKRVVAGCYLSCSGAMATTTPISLPSLPPLTSIVKPRSHNSLLFTSPLTLSTTLASRKAIHFHDPVARNHRKESNKLWSTFAAAEDVLPSDSTPLDNSQQIVSTTGDDGVATIIQALLFVAFVALTILTLGVVYIGVQDFLQKRERDKYEKEEASNEKNGKKKKKKTKARARAGPRGFGQKIDEDDVIDV